MTRKASFLFDSGYNCAQSTLVPYIDGLDLPEETAFRLTSVFGGGIAMTGNVCGAVAGSVMAIGLHNGYSSANDPEQKQKVISLTQQFIDEFTKKNGSIQCKDLLAYDMSIEAERNIIKEKGLTKTICPKMVSDASAIVDKILKKTTK